MRKKCVSSVILQALPTTISPVAVFIFNSNLCCLAKSWNVGMAWRTDGRKWKQDRCHQWSTRPDPVSPLVNIVFAWNLVCFEKGDGRTYERTTYAKTMITTGRDCGLASWINSDHYRLGQIDQYRTLYSHQVLLISQQICVRCGQCDFILAVLHLLLPSG